MDSAQTDVGTSLRQIYLGNHANWRSTCLLASG